jgi:hypothetical protein
MLQWANSIAAATFVVTATDPTTGELTYETDGSGNPVCSPAIDSTICLQNTTRLNGYAANIATVRQLTISWLNSVGSAPASP